MSRSRDFIRGLSASWVATFVTVGYSLLSVPLALRYLGVDEFGLFMIVLQAAGYFALIDLGMSGATARILIDYKDKRDSGEYGSVVSTSIAVFAVQSCIMTLLGIVAAPFVVKLLSIPSGLQPVAVHLLRWMAATFAVGTAMRIFSSVLYANRRIDLVNILMSLVPLASLFLIWKVLAAGGGLWWLPAAFVPPAVLAGAATGFACWRLGLLPSGGQWRKPRLGFFREMFALGRDIFMVNAGAQVLDASQILIVTRTMGLDAAAVWSVSSKLFALVFQMVTKIENTAVVIFSEMIARGETELLRQRFRQVYQLTAGITIVAAGLCIVVNRPFVVLWAGEDLAWSTLCNTLLALAVFVNCVTRCHVDLIVNTKNIGRLRYVYFLEAAAFVSGALWGGRHAGFPGVIVASLVCTLLFRGIYTSRRTAEFFGASWTTVTTDWLRNSLVAGAIWIPLSVLLAGWFPGTPAGGWPGLLGSVAVSGAAAMLVLWTIALPSGLRSELAANLSGRRRTQAGTPLT